MKIKIKILGAVFFAAVLAGVAQAGDTLDRVMRKQLLIDVTDQAYPPFSKLDEKGEMVGFDIDVAREIAKRLGVDMKVETPSFEILAAGRWKGRYDLCVCSMTPTEERKEVLDFIVKYYDSPAVIVTHSQNVSIKGPADLNGKMVGAEASTTYEKYLQKTLAIQGAAPIVYGFESVKLKPYESEMTAYHDLGLGDGKRLDAIVANYLTAQEQVEKSDGKFKIVGETLFKEPIWISADKGDAEWNEKIKSIVNGMVADGTLAKISEKWVGVDISAKP
jgi:polar amino acid transport system substrate-binding protein